MAINRFFKPVDYEYTPIPFQELVTLGKYYADERKQFEKDISDKIKSFGEFSSISDIDMANYRKESIGKFSSLLDEAAMNPNVLKDAAWRSKVLSRINDIDYNQLSRYKKSAENFDIRQKAVAELKSKGLYQEWFDDPLYRDLQNWDTKSMGVMNSLAPDEYITMRDLGSEYTKHLKPTFYKRVAPNSGQSMPFYNWMAISSADIRRQFEDHAQDLLSTDAGAKHYARFRGMIKSANPNVSEEQIVDSFIDALTIEQSDKLIETPILDTASLQSHLLNEKNKNPKGGSGNKTPSLPYIFPTSVSIDQQQEISNRSRKIETINPDLAKQIKTDNNVWTNALVDLYTEMAGNEDIVNVMKKLNVDLNDAGLKKEVDNASNDPTFLNAYIEGIMQMLPDDEKFNDIRKKHQNLRNRLATMSYEHNNLTNSALITNTLVNGITRDGSINLNEKYIKNPWISVFEEPSNAQLNMIDKAALSTVETNLNIPEQDIIIRAIFGEERKIPANMLKDNALSSYNWILKNFEGTQGAAIADAKKQTNYTREGSPVTELTGSWGNRNINASTDENYSIRDNTAKGLYGSVQIVSVDGFSPVLEPGKGTSPDQYTYRLTVKVPLSEIDKDVANKYITWMDEDLMDYNTIEEDTGLYTETENGIEYVHVPIFINRKLNSNTKGIMDAFYRQVIDGSTDLDKANEAQLSIANPGARSY